MLKFLKDRGFVDDENAGTNTSYYLFNGIVYRTISSIALWFSGNARTVHIRSDGAINSRNVIEDCGMQFIELCCSDLMIEALSLKIIIGRKVIRVFIFI